MKEDVNSNNAYDNVTNYTEYQKKFCTDADEKVLSFIYHFSTHYSKNPVCIEIIRSTFRAGYCYYFAVMLKEAFRRGDVCIMAPFGHFCWVDDSGIPYDIEGVYHGEPECMIPSNKMGDMLYNFLHVDGLYHYTTKEEIENLINNYKGGD